MTENKRWSLKKPITIVGTDICEEGIPHTNRSIVTHLNRYERKIQELETRNKRQYDLLSNLCDLMYKRDWKALEKIVEDWEESERLLQAEWVIVGMIE